eukprot:PRCOL_00004665-RA
MGALAGSLAGSQRGAEDSAGSGGKGSGEQQQRRKKKNAFTHFEVETAVPPTKRLGLHPFLRNTQCGDNITVDERDYIVNKVTYVYKLTRGRYVKDNRKLSVTPVGRHVTNMFLSSLYEDS